MSGRSSAPALIIISAIIHLYLWASGYRSITVIGPLFLAQGVVSVPFAVALGVLGRLGLLAAGAALMAGTAVGLLLSAQIGLFGFKDSLAAPYAGPVARRGVHRGGPACRRRGAHRRRQALTRSPRNAVARGQGRDRWPRRPGRYRPACLRVRLAARTGRRLTPRGR